MTSPDAILSALSSSHDRLEAAVAPLSPEQVSAPAYPSEWSIAQVMSHLGSGAEIFTLFLRSGLDGSAAPEREVFAQIWDVWNAKSPQDQAADSLTVDAAFLDQVRAAEPGQRDSFGIEMFTGFQDLAGFLQMRLNEHTVHSWDVLVALDPTTGLAADGVALILDQLPVMVARASKPSEADLSLAVHTTEPERSFRLEVAQGAASLTDQTDHADGSPTLRLPAEALIRLVYGRLDPDHTPTLEADGVDLDQLRQVFPGF